MQRISLVLVILTFSSVFSELNAQSADTLFIRASYARLERSAAYTLEIAKLMPAEGYAYKPSPGEMSFGQQLIHLCRNLGWLSSYYLANNAENPVSEADANLQRKDSIIALVSRTYDYALSKLNEFPVDRLSETVYFFAGPMNKLQIINLLGDHQTHHRGQLNVYLRLNGIKPPAYVGW